MSWCIRSVAKWSQNGPNRIAFGSCDSDTRCRARFPVCVVIRTHSGNSLLKFCLDFLVFSAKSTVTLVLISFWSLQSIQIVCPDRFNQSLFSSSAIYPKYFPAFTFLVNNSSERSENTSQSSKAPTKTFGVAFGSVSISGPCVDRFDAIFVVRIFGSL